MLSAGALDETFGTGGKVLTDVAGTHDEGYALATQADGKVVVVGGRRFGSGPGFRYNVSLARYLANGELDTSFGSGGLVIDTRFTEINAPKDIAIQADGKILIAGQSGNPSFTTTMAVARYNADGSVDATFGVNGVAKINFFSTTSSDEGNALAVQSDGKILVAGAGSDAAHRSFAVARLNGDGTLDAAYGTGGTATADFFDDDVANDVSLQDDGSLVVAGWTDNATSRLFALARFTSSGLLDTSFGGTGKVSFSFGGSVEAANGLETDAGGRIVVVGETDASGNNFAVARLNADGTLDSSFDGDGLLTLGGATTHEKGRDVEIDASGRIVLAGEAFESGATHFRLIRLLGGGALDTAFGAGGVVTTNVGGGNFSAARAIAILGDGKILVVGDANPPAVSNNDLALVRYVGTISPELTPNAASVSVNEGSLATTGGTYSDASGGTLVFSASAGVATGNGDGTWSWSYTAGDGSAGPFTVTVVIDNGQATDSVTFDVTVNNLAPTAVVTNGGPVAEGASATVSATASDFSAVDQASLRYFFSTSEAARDGATYATAGAASSQAFTFGDDGTYVVYVRVLDKDGGFSDYETSVVVQNAPPVITSLNGPVTGFPLIPVTFTGTASDLAGAGDPLSYNWSVTRGGASVAVGINSTLLFVPVQLGVYQIQLTVSDGDGGTDVETRFLTVDAPEINADLIAYHQGTWSVGVSNGSSAFASSAWASWGNVGGQAIRTGDFNGDGATDVLRLENGVWRVGIAASSAFGNDTWGNWGSSVWTSVTVGDVNGDGRDDVMGRLGGEWWVSLSTGTTFANRTLWTTWSNVAWTDTSLVDLNGDGRADLLSRVGGSWYAALSSGSIFGAAPLWAGWANIAWSTHVLDANGDGKSDVLGLYAGEWWVGVSTGSGFTTSKWAGWSTAVQWVDGRVGDFNGDGKDDVAARNSGDGAWWVGLSNGSTFASTSLWANWSIHVSWPNVVVGDFNGDGKADLAGRADGNWWVARSTGSGFISANWASGWNVAYSYVANGNVWTSGGGGGGSAMPAAPSGSAAKKSSSLASAPTFKVTLRTVEEESALSAFWSASEEDEEFASALLVASV